MLGDEMGQARRGEQGTFGRREGDERGDSALALAPGGRSQAPVQALAIDDAIGPHRAAAAGIAPSFARMGARRQVAAVEFHAADSITGKWA